MSKLLSCVALLALVAASPARATDLTVGLQGHFAIPSGKAADNTHLDGKTGFGLGLNFPVDLGNGHVFRPKVDYIAFNRETMGITSKSDTISVIADYNYYFAGQRQGAYLIAGLGYNSTKREISGTVYGLKASVDATTSGLAYNFGLGFAFNKTVALELKYMGADLPDFKYNGYTVDTSYTANAIVASVSITF